MMRRQGQSHKMVLGQMELVPKHKKKRPLEQRKKEQKHSHQMMDLFGILEVEDKKQLGLRNCLLPKSKSHRRSN